MTKSTIEQRVVILNAAREAHNAAAVMKELGRPLANIEAVRHAGAIMSETYRELTKVADAIAVQETAKGR